MSEMIDRVTEALKESFKTAITDGAGVPFEQTGVALPADAVWQRYARATMMSMREPTSAMVAALHAALDDRAVAPAAAGQEREIAEAIGEMFDEALAS